MVGRLWEGIGNSDLSLLTLTCLLDTQVEMAGGSWIQEWKSWEVALQEMLKGVFLAEMKEWQLVT